MTPVLTKPCLRGAFLGIPPPRVLQIKVLVVEQFLHNYTWTSRWLLLLKDWKMLESPLSQPLHPFLSRVRLARASPDKIHYVDLVRALVVPLLVVRGKVHQ